MDQLEQIFVHQLALTNQFRQIELANGLLDYPGEIPFDLKSPKAQKQLRATAWFIVEEIGEALEADGSPEELADVLHFIVELCLFSGVTPNDIHSKGWEALFELCSPFSQRLLIRNLAAAMHCLKAKPWKVNPKVSDTYQYKDFLVQVFYSFISFAKFYGLTANGLFYAYMGKAQVNQERIDGGI